MDRRFVIEGRSSIDLALVAQALQAAKAGATPENQRLLAKVGEGLDKLLTDQEILMLTRLPREQWADYLVFRYCFSTGHYYENLPDFPPYLLIEPTSHCNLKCSMCWHSDQSFHNNPEHMGFIALDLFKRVVDEAQAGGAKAITMASRGEPTLHKNLGEMLAYLAGKFFEIKINTNGTLLNEEIIHSILQADINFVVFSVDCHTPEAYARVRGKDLFAKVTRNIEKFNHIRATRYPSGNTITRVHGVRYDQGLQDQAFFDFWRGLCDQVSLGPCYDRWDIYHNAPKDKTEPCRVLFDRMYVWHDGSCNPCDPDYKSALKVGGLGEQSLRDIWNGPRYNELRSMHRQGRRGGIFPCDRCSL